MSLQLKEKDKKQKRFGYSFVSLQRKEKNEKQKKVGYSFVYLQRKEKDEKQKRVGYSFVSLQRKEKDKKRKKSGYGFVYRWGEGSLFVGAAAGAGADGAGLRQRQLAEDHTFLGTRSAAEGAAMMKCCSTGRDFEVHLILMLDCC